MASIMNSGVYCNLLRVLHFCVEIESTGCYVFNLYLTFKGQCTGPQFKNLAYISQVTAGQGRHQMVTNRGI